jgi:hypothetical protein
MLLPDVESLGLEPLEQARQLAGNALIDTKLVDHVVPPDMAFKAIMPGNRPGMQSNIRVLD